MLFHRASALPGTRLLTFQFVDVTHSEHVIRDALTLSVPANVTTIINVHDGEVKRAEEYTDEIALGAGGVLVSHEVERVFSYAHVADNLLMSGVIGVRVADKANIDPAGDNYDLSVYGVIKRKTT